MDALLTRVRLIPQVLQDAIFEYNVENHPDKMYCLHRELIQTTVHREKMMPVWSELQRNIPLYGHAKCKQCNSCVYGLKKVVDRILGNTFCGDTCTFHFFCKYVPAMGNQYKMINQNY